MKLCNENMHNNGVISDLVMVLNSKREKQKVIGAC